MDEIEQMVLIDKLIWVGGLAAPVIIGVAAVLIARQPEADRVRVCFVGAVAAFALGTVGSYAAGETILTTMDRVTHLPRTYSYRPGTECGTRSESAFSLVLL